MAPVSNAERQKRYRERLKQNPVKYEEMRKKHLERVKLNKLKIKEQNQSQKEKTRQKWREYSDRYYKRKKNKSFSDPTAPTIPNEHIIKRWKLKTIKLQKELKRCQEAFNMSLKTQETMRKQIYRLKQERIFNKNQSRGQTIVEARQRTALATGVSEVAVRQIVKEEKGRNADKRQEPPEKRPRARKRSRQTDSSSEEDSSDDNGDDDEQSSNYHDEEPEIEVGPGAVKIEPSDIEVHKEQAQTDPISLDVKTEPRGDEVDKQHTQGEPLTTAIASSVRLMGELDESSLFVETEMKVEEVENHEEGFS